jgi:phosphoadenosine phosphosulfate reductase
MTIDTNALSDLFAGLDAAGRLAALRAQVDGRIVFTTSFGLEDQAITHLIARSGLDIAFATLDTGRLFPETYKLWSETEERYGISISAFAPRGEAVEALVARDGIEGFYLSVEARKACCGVRKLEPLGRALAGAAGWITGLRAEQSAHRAASRLVELDTERGLVKANPLLDWTRDDLASYIRAEEIPYNVLHDKGFASIGCAPCTRAIRVGEPERAGRWWWEEDTKKECGLHIRDGKVVRGPVEEAA